MHPVAVSFGHLGLLGQVWLHDYVEGYLYTSERIHPES